MQYKKKLIKALFVGFVGSFIGIYIFTEPVWCFWSGIFTLITIAKILEE